MSHIHGDGWRSHSWSVQRVYQRTLWLASLVFPGSLLVRYFPLPERGPNELVTKEQRRRNGERRTNIDREPNGRASLKSRCKDNKNGMRHCDNTTPWYAIVRHFGLFYGFTRYSDQGDLLWSVVFAAIDGTCEVVGDLKDASYAEGDAGDPPIRSPYRDVVCRGVRMGHHQKHRQNATIRSRRISRLLSRPNIIASNWVLFWKAVNWAKTYLSLFICSHLFGCKVTKSNPFYLRNTFNRLYSNNFRERFLSFVGSSVVVKNFLFNTIFFQLI